MAVGNVETMTMVRSAIWAGCGLLLALGATNAVDKIEELTQAVVGLQIEMSLVKDAVSELPPPEMMLRIKIIEAEQKRLQRQIDRLENNIPGITGQVLPPYSYMPKVESNG